MKRIVLTDDEPIKFFTLLTPDKIEAVYHDVYNGVYMDCPGHCVAMVVIERDGKKRIDIEPI